MCACQRIHSLAEQAQSSCPPGHRMSHATKAGFSRARRQDPVLNQRRRSVGGTLDIAHRKSRRESRRAVGDSGPGVPVAGTGG